MKTRAFFISLFLVISFCSYSQAKKVTPAGKWVGRLICKTKDTCKNRKVTVFVSKKTEPNVYQLVIYNGADTTVAPYLTFEVLYDEPFQKAITFFPNANEQWDFYVNPAEMFGDYTRNRKLYYSVELKRSK